MFTSSWNTLQRGRHGYDNRDEDELHVSVVTVA